ncbi:hypothetical protein X566_06960 [Afipia sp. P52-10]|jgi:hypothetical protein|nr:hypothetical protein X566_06960 [Afipia sp. P52-10]
MSLYVTMHHRYQGMAVSETTVAILPIRMPGKPISSSDVMLYCAPVQQQACNKNIRET